MFCLWETLIVLSKVDVCAFCLLCVLVKNWAQIVKETVCIFIGFAWLCSWGCVDHFRLATTTTDHRRILLHLVFNQFQQLLHLCPLLIGPEYPPNKLPKEPLLNLIDNINVRKLTLKWILPINSLIQYTSKWETIWLRIYIEVCVVI